MKLIRWSVALLVVGALVAGAALAQQNNWPNRQNRQNQQNQQNQTVKGAAHAPTDTDQTAENRQTIPAPAEARPEPSAVGDGNLADAARKTPLGIVRLTMDKDRSTLGFLIAGADSDHALVVTNFLSIAGAKWIRAETCDNTKLEVEGLLKYNETQDLALLQVKVPESKAGDKKKTESGAGGFFDAAGSKAANSKKPRLLELAEKNVGEGRVVYAIGLPDANQPTAGWAEFGKVQKLVSGADAGAPQETQWLQTEPVISQNNRGGALVDRDGKVVGLLTFAGRTETGPCLSVPVSVIRDLLDRPSLDVSTFYPNPKGAFAWPSGRAVKTETFPAGRAISTAAAVKSSLECATCEGHGYLVTPQFTVDQKTGARTPGADLQTSCDDCGGTGIVIKPSIHELLAALTRVVLNHDPKTPNSEIIRAKTAVQDAFDRAAVDRLMLANTLDVTAGKLLGDPDANRGAAVVFIAELGPKLKWKEGREGRDIQWVLAYGSNVWAITYGAEARSNRSFGAPVIKAPPVQPGGRRGQPAAAPPVVRANTRYVLVAGIIEGDTLLDNGKAIYHAPLIRVADIDGLRN